MAPWAYQVEAYQPRLATSVRSVVDGAVLLEDTVFHPQGGGQPADSGALTGEGGPWPVLGVEETPGGILHRLAPGATPPTVGLAIEASIDWPRRYRFMRYHTALHLLSGVVHQRFASGITGNQIGEDRARMDFSIPEFTRSLAEELIAATNAVAARSLPVEVRFISPEERARRPELVRVATDGASAPRSEVRLVDIVGFDVQADGGTHVRSTDEVGVLRLDRIENKGSKNKRLYVALDDRPTPPPGPPA
jgi:misacylated tRNA(Ala) deacylase